MPALIWDEVERSAAALREAGGPIEVAVILGSGLSGFADAIEDATPVGYEAIPHFVRSTVAGHAGRYVVGRIGGRRVGVFAGRFHHYEGWEPAKIVLPVRVAHALGAQTLIVTNAAGSTRRELAPGTLMLMSDHINNLGWNPLRGPNDPAHGPRFPSLNDAYPKRLRDLAREVARSQGIELAEGVYMANAGPTYESPAEVRMMALLGADAIGMSTVPEVIAAAHLGLPVLGISCLTNWGAGLAPTAPTHEEVIASGREVESRFVRLLTGVIAALPGARA